jgi:3-phenylpropionate/trans-cinnamate dioxygenase ferredoxin reductase component
MQHPYVIVGGGVAGAAAIEGIRAHDKVGDILLLTRENYPPYNRPPLSKDLWFGKKTLDEVPVHDDAWYREQGVTLGLRRDITELDPERRMLIDDRGTEYGYERLLLATGARPRRLNVTGATIEGIHYFRDLDDYLFLSKAASRFEHALVIGAGFIGMELSAALTHAGKQVTLLYPGETPLGRLLPRDLGLFVADFYRQKGVETVSGDEVVGFDEAEGRIHVRTRGGGVVTTQIVLAGIGVEPQTDLADIAGLEVRDGIVVDEFARTSDPAIWAAGDVTEFPDLVLARSRRIEHWDHAIQHGRCAGANMAGADEPYTALPFFFGDLFELGFEAVGDLDSSLDLHSVWHEPFREGVVFYLAEDVVRGVLLWNVWDSVDWARGLIRDAKPLASAERETLAASRWVPA